MKRYYFYFQWRHCCCLWIVRPRASRRSSQWISLYRFRPRGCRFSMHARCSSHLRRPSSETLPPRAASKSRRLTGSGISARTMKGHVLQGRVHIQGPDQVHGRSFGQSTTPITYSRTTTTTSTAAASAPQSTECRPRSSAALLTSSTLRYPCLLEPVEKARCVIWHRAAQRTMSSTRTHTAHRRKRIQSPRPMLLARM